MAANDELLALADELEGVSLKDDCESCLASGTSLCRGDLECAESAHKACAKRLREIVEHDAGEVTTMSAYDLLPDDDREAIAWVREQGGLEAVKASIHQGAMGHGCLLKIAHALGTSIYDGSDNADALLEKLSERLMPDGVEWPTVDGKPVDFVTGYEPSLGVLEAVSIYSNGACEVMSHDGIVKNATEIHVFKPKVVDADGVEIRVGDMVWVVGDVLTSMQVLEVKPSDDSDEPEHLVWCGETWGESLNYAKKWRIPDQLTHEQPDTWERLEHDAEKTVCEYFGANYDCANCPLESSRCAEEVKKDIIRRARKLAERGE